MSSQGIFEVEISLVPPSKRDAIASLGGSNIIVPTGSITDIVNKLIRASSIILVGVFAILGLREGEVAFTRWFELSQLVDLVFGEQTAIVVADVGVATCSV